ncbi:MAG: hypothetical protein ACRYG8_20435 [Janthinobacterium lividum]
MNEKSADPHLENLLLEGLASNRLPLDAGFLKGIEVRTAQILDSARSVKTVETD